MKIEFRRTMPSWDHKRCLHSSESNNLSHFVLRNWKFSDWFLIEAKNGPFKNLTQNLLVKIYLPATYKDTDAILSYHVAMDNLGKTINVHGKMLEKKFLKTATKI